MRWSDRRQFMKGSCSVLGSISFAACLEPRSDSQRDVDTGDQRDVDAGTTTDADTDAASDEEPDTTSLPDDGAVVFVYDDGPINDITQALPAHQEFDAPATTGIVSDWIGREDFNDADWMDVSHLERLVDAGWEISSHTTVHASLGAFELVEDAESTDTRIYPAERRHGYHSGWDLEITDGEQTVRRTVVESGHDDVGGYIELDDELGVSFDATETVERYPAEHMHELLGESKRELEELGFEVNTLLAPYDDVNDRTVEFAKEYYDGIANARPGSRINDPETFDPYQTRRDYFIEFTTPEAVERDLDRITAEGALGLFGAHTRQDEVTTERIRQTLEGVEARDIEVLTLREAIDRVAA